MNIQNIKKRIAFLLCALTLSLSITSVYTISVEASTVIHASLYKLVDMCLSKTGIVANNSIIQTISNKILDTFGDVVTEYTTYLETTYGDTTLVNTDTFDEFVDSIGQTGVFIYDMVRTAIALSLDIASITLEELADLLIDVSGEGIIGGGAYTIADDAVEYIREKFDEYAESESDYYYIDTIGPNDVHPGWFPTKATYELTKKVLSESPYPLIIEFTAGTSGNYFSTTSANTSSFKGARIFICSNGLMLVESDTFYEAYFYYFIAYDNDWDVLTYQTPNLADWGSHTYTSFEELYAKSDMYYSRTDVYSYLERKQLYTSSMLGICTNDGRQMKVFKDASTMKLYSVDEQPYYLVQNNDYSTTNDNSVKFDGTYYQNNSETYSYDIIQNEIDNSTEINEETVNNIVNNTTSTIINNYYGSANSDNNGDGDNDGNNNDTTDYDDEYVKAEISGLGGALIGIALEHYDTIGEVVTTIRDGMETVTDPINDITDIIGTTVGTVNETAVEVSADLEDTAGLMGELFAFIPEDIMLLIKTSLVASLGIGLWKALRG